MIYTNPHDVEFHVPFRVHPDRTITTRTDEHVPECYWDPDTMGVDLCGADDQWLPMDGYSGQDRYSGPVMHSSEFIGGRLKDDILSEPGVYVICVVEVMPDDEDCDDDCEPAGWVVLRHVSS